MKYKIELWCANERWERSVSYNGQYAYSEAAQIVAEPLNAKYTWRIVPVNATTIWRDGVESVRKPYRRHASVTQLELRGAEAMLTSAIKHTTDKGPCYPQAFEAYCILIDARLLVRRQLEAL